MSIQYRVIAAMLRLGEFTVAELSEAADAKSASVRTVLNRRATDVEEVRVIPREGPGGRAKVYRVREDRRADLHALVAPLARMEEAVRPLVGDPLSATLATTHDLLVRRVPLATADELPDLLSSAEIALRIAADTPSESAELH